MSNVDVDKQSHKSGEDDKPVELVEETLSQHSEVHLEDEKEHASSEVELGSAAEKTEEAEKEEGEDLDKESEAVVNEQSVEVLTVGQTTSEDTIHSVAQEDHLDDETKDEKVEDAQTSLHDEIDEIKSRESYKQVKYELSAGSVESPFNGKGLMLDISTYSISAMNKGDSDGKRTKRRLTPIFLDIMCKKNENKTKQLLLKGSDMKNKLNRRVNDYDLKDICDYLETHESVMSVDLSYNDISSDGLSHFIVPFLKNNSSLKALVLSNNELSVEGIEAIADNSSEIRLNTLRLNGNRLGPKSGLVISRLLEGCKTLRHLDVSETDQDVGSLACIAATLRPDYVQWEVKREVFIRYPIPEEEPMQNKYLQPSSPSALALYLRQLVLDENADEEESQHSLSPSDKFRINCTAHPDWTKSLKTTKMEQDDVLEENVESSPSDISGDRVVMNDISEDNFDSDEMDRVPLEILFLDRILGHFHYQPLTYHFARILSDMIAVNNSLLELHLEKNSLTDSDVDVLCEGLKRNVKLRLLDLSVNHIGCLGLAALALCLPTTNLEALVLNHNMISNHGARSLCFKLPSTKLRMLDLAFNKISDYGMMDLLYTMRKEPKMLVLFIWGNPITCVTLEKVKEYLLQGWLVTDSLDIQLYQVDGELAHGWRRSADSYKGHYYDLETQSNLKPPPHSYGDPLEFVHYDPVYQRRLAETIPKNFAYPPDNANTCTN